MTPFTQRLQQHKKQQRQRQRETRWRTQAWLDFSSNDYLGLKNHPALIETATEALKQYGVGSGASAMVSGYQPPHAELEERLALLTQRDRAIVFPSGFQANLGVITALLSRHDYLWQDKFNHASLIDAGILSRAKMKRYAHCQWQSLEAQLKQTQAARQGHVTVVATEAVFSTQGAQAPLEKLASICKQQHALLVVDEAHSIGVFGENGAGLVATQGLTQAQVPLIIGTFGKAIGTAGAFVAGQADLIETILQFARSYTYTTAMPPAIAAATSQSFELIATGHYQQQLHDNIRYFQQAAKDYDLPILPSQSAIQALVLNHIPTAQNIVEDLKKNNILVTLMRPPTVPPGQVIIRISLSALHAKKDIDFLIEKLVSFADVQCDSSAHVLRAPLSGGSGKVFNEACMPRLALLHGWGFTSRIWQPALDQLQQSFSVTLVDLPGYGENPTYPEKYDAEALCEQLKSNIPHGSICLGWSLGGLLALQFALQYPGHLQGMIAMASTPYFMKTEHWPGVDENLFEQFASQLVTNYQPTLKQFVTLQSLGCDNPYELTKKLTQVTKQFIQPSDEVLQGGLGILKQLDLREQLKNITCPTLYCLGEHDKFVPSSIANYLPQWHPQAKVNVIKRAGHMPFFSHQEDCFSLINHFITTLCHPMEYNA